MISPFSVLYIPQETNFTVKLARLHFWSWQATTVYLWPTNSLTDAEAEELVATKIIPMQHKICMKDECFPFWLPCRRSFVEMEEVQQKLVPVCQIDFPAVYFIFLTLGFVIDNWQLWQEQIVLKKSARLWVETKPGMSTQLENRVIQNFVEEKKNREEYGDEEGRTWGNGEEGEKFLCGSNLRDNILIISGTIFFIDTWKTSQELRMLSRSLSVY